MDKIEMKVSGPLERITHLPDSMQYNVLLRSTFSLVPSKEEIPRPLAFVQPTSVADVQLVTQWAQKEKLPLCVRVGGHDSLRRSTLGGTVVIDLTALKEIEILLDEQSEATGDGLKPAGIAKIGGGTLTVDLLAALKAQGCMVPTAAAESVGHAGWAMLGGYSCMSGVLGMGVDQIVGATLVTANGDVVTVSESKNSDLLWGVRGGGGNFGIVVELEIKIYKIDKFLAGGLVFDSQDLSSTITNFLTAYSHLQSSPEMPPGFYGLVGVVNIPKLGKGLVFTYVWLSEDRTGETAWRQRMKSLGGVKCIVDAVTEVNASQMVANMSKVAPYGVYGLFKSVNVSGDALRNEDFLKITVQNLVQMPSLPGCALTIQQYRPPVTSNVESQAVWSPRDPHHMLLLIGTSPDDQHPRLQESIDWVDNFEASLRDIVLAKAYSPFSFKTDLGSGEEKFRSLQEKWDPEGMWSNAIPGI
ncbi:hypothetical protein BP5796_07072 [Coleophoma crateriformis]|uniref:FAD-binding PCMH-type domain-containing protein n=1 Tax=Coleophoma crateriformis TaxID=565419 RepID=A0A3D8RI34_9HELO|nr:hypothetical protein BP5796_07072 [Coleophoma crateriformis]